MLRKTAAKAFGTGAETTADVPPARHETHRGAALERLFGELHGLLIEFEKRRSQADADATADRPAATAGARGERDEEVQSCSEDGEQKIEVTRPRSLSQGVEFSVIGPFYACRFLNTMNDFIHVSTFAAEALEGHSTPVRKEILSVHPYWGTYRPILKPLPSPRGARAARTPGLTGGRGARTAFCYTSAAELAAHYLDLVCGD